MRQLKRIHSWRPAALSVLAGALVAGCEPRPGADDNEQLSRAQEATPLREGPQDRARERGQAAQASGQAGSARDTDAGNGAAPGPARSTGSQEQRTARAVLEPTQDNRASGVVEFEAREDGKLTITAMIDGLAPGRHGFHIHENGDCSGPNAESAGDHFNPGDHPHGAPDDAADSRHAGDLGNVMAEDDGTAEARLEDAELALEGELRIVGRAVIVHAGADDLQSQPSGGAGDPVACGVIRRPETPRTASTG